MSAKNTPQPKRRLVLQSAAGILLCALPLGARAAEGAADVAVADPAARDDAGPRGPSAGRTR